MSLYNDLTTVLTPYANKINQNESDIGDIQDTLEHLDVETDTTLTQSGAPADAKAVGDEIADLKSDLSESVGDLKSALHIYTGNDEIEYSDRTLRQYIATNGTTVQWDTPSVSSLTQIKWAVVECNPGDKFTVNGKGGNFDRLWAFADSEKNILDPRALAGISANDLVITAPENAAYLILNNEVDTKSYIGDFVVKRVSALEKKIDETDDTLYKRGTVMLVAGSYINSTNGQKVSNSDFSASEYIDEKYIDGIYACFGANISVAYYDNTMEFIIGQTVGSDSLSIKFAMLSKPTNCKWVRFSNRHTVLADANVYIIRKLTGNNLLADNIGFASDIGLSQLVISDVSVKNYDQLSFPDAGYINSTTGKIQTVSWASVSDYIPVKFVTHVYTYLESSTTGIAYYADEDEETFISSESVSKGLGWRKLIIPANAKFVRFTACYLSDNGLNDATYAKAVNVIPLMGDTMLADIKTPELTTGGYIRTSDGVKMSVVWCSYSDFVALNEVTHIYTNSSSNIGICYFTADKSYLSGFDGGSRTTGKWYKLNPPKNAKYVRFSNRNDRMPDSSVKTANILNDRLEWMYASLSSDIANTPSAENIIPMYDDLICIGDSLTWSQVYTSDTTQRKAFEPYPSILGKLCGVTSHAYATPGDSAVLWWQRSSTGAFADHGLYIVFLGTNGGLTDTIDADCVGDDPDQFDKTTNTGAYGAILQTIKNNGDKAVLIKPWAGGGSSLSVTQNVIDQFAEKYSFAVIDINLPERATEQYHLYPNGSGANGLHFNDLGYAWMANAIKAQINLLGPADKFNIMRTQ